MKKIAISAAWLLSLAITVWISTALTRADPVMSRSVEIAKATKDLRVNGDFVSDDLRGLKEENEHLRSQLDAAKNASMQQALAELLRQAKDSTQLSKTTHVPSAGSVFESMVDSQQRNTGMFGGLDDSMRALAAFARMGDKGVEFLLDVATDDENYSEEDRKAAMEMLSLLPHPDVLKFFLQQMESPTESDEGIDYRAEVYSQIKSLTGDVVTNQSETLNAYAQDLLSRGDADLMCALALYHADPVAIKRLHEPATFGPATFEHVVYAAQRLHTEQAHDYLVEAQRIVKDSDTQQRIAEALEGWDN